MSNALCGPSNALQNIQKHTSVDRTLQQDRLAFNSSPSQGFRSAPGPGAGRLDDEFHAFQAGPLAGGQHSFHHELAQPPGAFQSPMTQMPEWASEFQHLTVNDGRSSPIPSSQFRHEAPLHRGTRGGWEQEFIRQPGNALTQPSFVPQFGGPTWQSPQQIQPFPSFQSPFNHLSPVAQQKQPEPVIDFDTYDESAFERAFDAASSEILTAESAVPAFLEEALQTYYQNSGDVRQLLQQRSGSIQADGNVLDEESAAAQSYHQQEIDQFDMNNACVDPGDVLGEFDFDGFLAEQEGLAETATMAEAQNSTEMLTDLGRFEADNLSPEVASSDKWQPPQENIVNASDAILVDSLSETERVNPDVQADELSRTAGQLLDNLKDEQSKKFQNSTFLALMRQLRDREVRVEGDKMVDSTQALHPGGHMYPSLESRSKNATVNDEPSTNIPKKVAS